MSASEPQALNVLAVIPARHASSRFPGKPLSSIAGKPMIQHVVERVRRARRVSRVLVATDDSAIRDAVRGFGGKRFSPAEIMRRARIALPKSPRISPLTFTSTCREMSLSSIPGRSRS